MSENTALTYYKPKDCYNTSHRLTRLDWSNQIDKRTGYYQPDERVGKASNSIVSKRLCFTNARAVYDFARITVIF